MSNDTKRMVLTMALSLGILLSWQFFFAPKQLPQENTVPVQQEVAKVSDPAPSVLAPTIPKQSFNLTKAGNLFTLQSDFSIENVNTPKVKNTFKEVVGGQDPFSIQLIDETTKRAEVLKVNFSNVSESEMIGEVEGKGIKVRALILDNGRLSLTLNSQTPNRYRIVFKSTKEAGENGKHRDFIFLGKSTERNAVDKSFDEEEKVKWMGIDHKFHLAAFILPEKLQAKVSGKESGEMTVDFSEPTTEFKGDFLFAVKNYDELAKMGDNLKLAVDFGVFGILAVPILRGLQFFYTWIPNYGWSIVLLTLLIRLITFPLQWKSFKSMKKMQDIQPELNKIKEKYKGDAQKMQKETMALFKKAGANPLGGCLPILIQMPVFFAFYKVLGEAIELVGAPWMFWIKDLSHKDPFFVLPVLMTAAMFLQQKYTPTTTVDPTQKKIMMFMPLIFGFIMKDLPSGLVLYIFVSTIFGVIQQLWVYKSSPA
jgi:YidC/Oxa1 family membrane protein insertase